MLLAGVAIALAGMRVGAQAEEGAMNPTPLPASPSPDSRTIEVTGNGEAHVAPDVASLNLAIETHAPTAQQSAGQNAALAQRYFAEAATLGKSMLASLPTNRALLNHLQSYRLQRI